jgi:hypothetical protein
MVVWQLIVNYYRYRDKLVITCVDKWLNSVNFKILNICNDKDIEIFTISYSSKMQHAITNYSTTKSFIRDNRNFDSSEFNSTIYFDKNSSRPEIRVNRVRDNGSQLYLYMSTLGLKSDHRWNIWSLTDIFTLGYFTCLFHNLSN